MEHLIPGRDTWRRSKMGENLCFAIAWNNPVTQTRKYLLSLFRDVADEISEPAGRRRAIDYLEQK